jgi:DNA-binding NarL/FixJ family response regulator
VAVGEKLFIRNVDKLELGHLINAVIRMKPLEFYDAEGTPLLTRREEGVVRLVAEGLKNHEIGIELNVTEHSI